jgi:hypothetical protein
LARRRPSAWVTAGGGDRRLGQAEQRLEQPLDRGRGAQVAPRTTSRHAARRIVDDAGEMIGGGRVLAGEDRVADVGRARAVKSRPSPRSQTAVPARASAFGAVEPPACGVVARARDRRAGRGRCRDRGRRRHRRAARSATRRRCRRGCRSRDRRALRLQPLERGGVSAAARDWTSGSPSHSRPSQRRSSMIPSTNSGGSGRVEILDPQQEFPPFPAAREIVAERRAIRRGRDAAGRSALGAKRVVIICPAL